MKETTTEDEIGEGNIITESKFLSVTEENFISQKISAMALTMSFTKETPTTAEITTISFVKTSNLIYFHSYK